MPYRVAKFIIHSLRIAELRKESKNLSISYSPLCMPLPACSVVIGLCVPFLSSHNSIAEIWKLAGAARTSPSSRCHMHASPVSSPADRESNKRASVSQLLTTRPPPRELAVTRTWSGLCHAAAIDRLSLQLQNNTAFESGG